MDRQLEKKKWPMRRIFSYVSFGVVGLLTILAVMTGNESSLNVEANQLTVSKVTVGSFTEYVPVICIVKPANTVNLSTEEGGRVETVFVESGSRVHAGDKILRLSNASLLMTFLNNQAQLNRVQNDLRTAQLQLGKIRLDIAKDKVELGFLLERIKQKFESNKVSYDDGMIAQQEYEDIKREYEYLAQKQRLAIDSQQKELGFKEEQVKELELSVKQMEIPLDLVKQQYDKLTVKAPISGLLTSLNAEKGEPKEPGETLGQIDSTDGYKLKGEIDEHFINRLEPGIEGDFSYGDKSYKMKVIKVFTNAIDGKCEVEGVFDTVIPKDIKRGQSLHVRLHLSKASQALLLSQGGFFQNTAGNWVYVVDKTGKKANKRFIHIGRQNPQYFEILDGLTPGENVIISSYDNYGNKDTLLLN